MKITGTKCIAQGTAGGRVFVALHERTYHHKGKDRNYFIASRHTELADPAVKRPDAVAIVGVLKAKEPGTPDRLVMTREFRVAIGRHEYSFPAGLVDPSDYSEDSPILTGVLRAAKREFQEETGLEFSPYCNSPINLYSSAGFTDESTAVVIGVAHGEPSTAGNEETEDIEIKLLSQGDMWALMRAAEVGDEAISKLSWPFLYFYSRYGMGS